MSGCTCGCAGLQNNSGYQSDCSGSGATSIGDSSPVAIVAGLSAYQLAVAGGFSGTQEEWLASLKATVPWANYDASTGTLTLDASILKLSITNLPTSQPDDNSQVWLNKGNLALGPVTE